MTHSLVCESLRVGTLAPFLQETGLVRSTHCPRLRVRLCEEVRAPAIGRRRCNCWPRHSADTMWERSREWHQIADGFNTQQTLQTNGVRTTEKYTRSQRWFLNKWVCVCVFVLYLLGVPIPCTRKDPTAWVGGLLVDIFHIQHMSE